LFKIEILPGHYKFPGSAAVGCGVVFPQGRTFKCSSFPHSSFLAIRNFLFVPGTKKGISKARERKLIFFADKRAFFSVVVLPELFFQYFSSSS
jgi:hypothetical protein